MQILHRGSTNVLRLIEYTDEVTGLAVTNATVTGTLYNPDGTIVTGANAVSMAFVASGWIPEKQALGPQYRGIIASTVALPLPKYGVKYHASNPDGVRDFTDTCIVEDG